MTYTPIPVLIKKENSYFIVCNGCLLTISIASQTEIPNGWEKIYLPGWVGCFHACSSVCREHIIQRNRLLDEEVIVRSIVTIE